MTFRKINALAFVAATGLAGVANAALVALDIQVDPAAKTFDVFADLSDNDNRGLASYGIDVTAQGGFVSITSSLNQSPREFDAVLNDFKGFTLFRQNGTNGLDIRASQDTIGGNAAKLILDAGRLSPVRLASGTFTGNVGTLTASLRAGQFFNVFPSNYAIGDSTEPATLVTPDSAPVPEPASVGAAGLLVLGLAARRRRGRVPSPTA